MKTSIIIILLYATFIVAAITGEVKCIIKMVNCNWDPIGKAEIIYTIGVVTGTGVVIGYLDIKDK